MALSAIGAYGSASASVSGTSLVIPADAAYACAVGDVIIVTVCSDNIQTTDGESTLVTSVSETANGAFTKAMEYTNGQGEAGQGITTSVWYKRLSITSAAGVGNITVTFGTAVTARAAAARVFHTDQPFVQVAQIIGEASDVDAPTMSIVGLPSKEYLFFRATGVEWDNWGYIGTTDYSQANFAGSGDGGGDEENQVTTVSEYRILTGTGDTTNPDVVGTTETSTTTFTSHTTAMLNPERGLFSHMPIPFTQSTVEFVRSDQDCSLCRVQFNLGSFRTTSISSTFLTTIQNCFNALRAGGNKCILRFSYDDSTAGNDATLSRIQSHLDQLSPYINNNKDVILVMEAGFIGGWGEWAYSVNFGNINSLTTANKNDRKAVIEKILAVLPLEIPVLIRYPDSKQDFYGTTALTDAEAFNGTNKARVGHHNDAFVSSTDDFGTYRGDIAADKAYLALETKWLPNGGESAAYSPPRSDAATAEAELAQFHYTYLNFSYFPDTIAAWTSAGRMDDIALKLGYHLYLTEATLPVQGFVNGTMQVQLELTNDGYAAPVRNRPVRIVLKEQTSGVEFTADLPVDVRYWLPGTISVNETVDLPSGITAGVYDILLSFPDGASTLENDVRYNMQLANNTIYDALTGYHDLGVAMTVSTAPPQISSIYMALEETGGTTLTATTGSYTITGNAASLKRGLKLTGDAGSLTLTGQAATLLRDRRMAADVAELRIFGYEAGLVTQGNLEAIAGSYAITGNDTTLKVDRYMQGGRTDYEITGFAATLTGPVPPPEPVGPGKSRAALMQMFQQRHLKQQSDLRKQLASTPTPTPPKKPLKTAPTAEEVAQKRLRKAILEEIAALEEDIGDFDEVGMDLGLPQEPAAPPVGVLEQMASLAPPEPQGYNEQQAEQTLLELYNARLRK